MPRASTGTNVGLTALVTLALGACSLFVDTDGLSGGSGDAAIANDASSDAPLASDAQTPTDATAPSDGGDAAASPFCASHPGHSLCYDFDESTMLPSYDNPAFDPGHMVIDPTQSVSPPQSLLTIFDSGSATQSFQKNISATKGGKLSWSLDVKYNATDMTTGQTTCLAVDVPLVAELTDHYFYLQTYFGSLNISEAASPADGGATSYYSWTLQSPLVVGSWLHIEWTIDGSTGNMTFSFNGTPQPSQTAQFGFPSGAGQLTLGGFGGNLPARTTVNIDNVLIDY
jgi:hypothetical protein